MLFLDVAKLFLENNYPNIKFLIFGSGDEEQFLIKRCKNESISNVIFKGRIQKRYIPFVLNHGDINLLHNYSTVLDKYGQSQNKLFEYLAAGKCIIQSYSNEYSVIEKYECGVVVKNQNVDNIYREIFDVVENSDLRKKWEKMQEKQHIVTIIMP